MNLTRRSFIAVGAGALGAGVLAACGGSSSSSTTDEPFGTADAGSTPVGSSDVAGFTVVQRFPTTSLTPGRVRLPISLADDTATLMTTGPETLTGRIVDIDGVELATITGARRSIGEGAPLYWSIEATLDEPGVYGLVIDGSTNEPAAFQLFDPADVAVPTPGRALPAFDTPTVDDPRGVDPICTLTPEPCPFHEVTLTAALAAGLPVVYLIGTPAFCTTGTCAPGLEFLVTVAGEYAGRATFVHAEVYADPAGTTVAPAVEAIGTDYEPLLFITDADGVVVERLDVVWDPTDLAAALGRHIG